MRLNIDTTSVKEKVKAAVESAASGTEMIAAGVPAVPVMTAVTEQKKIMHIITIEEVHKQQAIQGGEDFDMMDTNQILNFAADPQLKYLEALKLMLGEAKIKDLKGAGSIILELEKAINMADIPKLKLELKNGLKTGFFEKLFSAVQAFIKKHELLQTTVQKIQDGIQNNLHEIAKENARLDEMFSETKGNFYELGVYIYAGEVAIDKAIVKYKDIAVPASQGDSNMLIELKRLRENMIQFNSRMMGLKVAYTRAPMRMDEILIQQSAARAEAVNQMNMLLTDLPDFVLTLNSLVGLIKLQQAMIDRERRDKMRQKLDQARGDLLEQVAVETKQALLEWDSKLDELEKNSERLKALGKKLKEIEDDGLKRMKEGETTLVNISKDFQESQINIIESPAV